MFAPAGTPADVIAKVNQAVNAALKDGEVRARFDTFGLVPTEVGTWMMHCHILEHAEAGMMTTIAVRAP